MNAGAFARESPFVTRPLSLFIGERWIGNAIAYGPHRDGQRPGGPSPTRAQIREDLRLIAKHWGMLRLYGSVGSAETILEVIHQDRLDVRVMLGVWIEAEERRDSAGAVVATLPGERKANRQEIESAVRLAAAYPELVLALAVGNETQVAWSSHRIPEALLVAYVREARARTRIPVTTADDFNFWNKPASRAMADELDFVMTHAHPMWNGLQLAEALDWTKRTCAEVQAMHPGKPLVLGETGWATQKHDEGEQATLIKGEPGEDPQAVFHRELTAWVDAGADPDVLVRGLRRELEGRRPARRGGEALGPVPRRPDPQAGHGREGRTLMVLARSIAPAAAGEFTTLDGEDYYRIAGYDRMRAVPDEHRERLAISGCSSRPAAD